MADEFKSPNVCAEFANCKFSFANSLTASNISLKTLQISLSQFIKPNELIGHFEKKN